MLPPNEVIKMFKKGFLVLIGLLLIGLMATARDAMAKSFGCRLDDQGAICIKYV